MAGEVKGKIYEAITKVALEMAIKGNRKGWKVLWHEQPEWVTIEADLALGKDKNYIEALFLVTHSTSEKLSEKKFWRNYGELFQWKVQGTKPIACYDILFDALFKPELLKINDAFSDTTLVVPERHYGKIILDYVNRRPKDFGNSDEKRVAHVETLMGPGKHYEVTFAKAMGELAADLKEMLGHENKKVVGLWKVLRLVDTRKYAVPATRNTYIRNGIAKLIIFDDTTRQHVYDSVHKGKEIDDDKVPKYAKSLSLFAEDLVGSRIEDKEILSAIKTLGKETCERVIGRVPSRMQQYISVLQASENNLLACDYVVRKFEHLTSTEGMMKALMDCYKDPSSLLSAAGKVARDPVDNWLFVYCMTIEKALVNKVVAYGLSNLAEETGIREIGSLGGVIISPFINREKELSPRILKAVAEVFAGRIKRTGRDMLASKDFKNTMCKMLVQRQLYILSNYRFFDPIGDLIISEFEGHKISFKKEMITTCLREYSGAKAAKTGFLTTGTDTLVFWQTVTEAGRIHKTKELSARFRATKAMWDGEEFSLRPSAKKIFFVADGEWREEDFRMLMRSGVDRIFYPDETSELVKAVASGSLKDPSSLSIKTRKSVSG